jgi:hypothetical protein
MAIMRPDERQQLLADLAKGRIFLFAALEGVTDHLAKRRPASGKWSVLECVEHVAVAEDFLFGQIVAATQTHSETTMVDARREALIVERSLDRTKQISAPESLLPIGRFQTIADAVQSFVVSRDRTIRFVENNREDLRCKLTSHPIAGKVNCYEVLLLMATHPHRHAKQIEEIRIALG